MTAPQKVYVQSIKAPMLKYEVVSFDPATKLCKMKTEKGIMVEIADFSKATCERFGYTLVKE